MMTLVYVILNSYPILQTFVRKCYLKSDTDQS